MGVLIASHWRLVRRSLFLWLAITLVVGTMQSTSSWTSTLPGLTTYAFVFLMLSAAVGARTFASGIEGSSAAWLRSLPIGSGRAALVRCTLGLALVTASFALVALVMAFVAPSILRSLGETPGAFHLGDLRLEALACLATFSASAYFAASFERVGASRQAGLAGFAVGVVWTMVIARSEMLQLLLWLVAVLGLIAAARLWRRRGIDDGPDLRVLRSVAPRDLALVLLVQVAFIVVPLCPLVLDRVAGAAPFLGTSELILATLAWLAFGVLALPWAWRDASARGVRGWRRIGALTLVSSGVGLWWWRALRPRGSLVRCASCRLRRLDASVRCPRCGGEALRFPRRRHLRRLVPATPAEVAGASFIALTFGGCVVGTQRYVHTCEIRSSLTGAEIKLGERSSSDVLRRWRLGRSMGPGLMVSSYSRAATSERRVRLPVRIDDLGAMLSERSGSDDLPSTGELLAGVIDSSQTLDVRYHGHPCALERVEVSVETRPFVLAVNIGMELTCPELDRFVDELASAYRADRVTDEQIAAAALWGDGIFRYLLHLPSVTPANRTWSRALFRAVLAARRDIQEMPAERLFERIDARAAEDMNAADVWYKARQSWSPYALEFEALAMRGEALAAELSDRIERGDAAGLLVAGVGRINGCWDACERAWRRRESTTFKPEELAWVLLMLDVDRAVALIEADWTELGYRDRRSIAELLGYTGRADVREWIIVNGRFGDSPQNDDLVKRFGWGYTLDDYAF